MCLAVTCLVGCGSGNVSSTSTQSSLSSVASSAQSSSSSSVAPSVFRLEEGEPGFCLLEGVVESEHLGFTGQGYANATNAVAAGITWQVDAEASGTYSVTLSFANGGAEARQGTLTVNGSSHGTVDFAVTSAWDNWQTLTFPLSMERGSNVIRLTGTSATGLPNLDSLAFSSTNLSAGDCHAVEPLAQNAPITVWLAGDSTVAPVANSLTCTGNGNTQKQTGWGAAFQPYFNEKVTVKNSAVGGRSVRSWLYETTDVADSSGECIRNRDASGNLILQNRWVEMLNNMKAGDYLLIQFGINDGSPTCGRHVGSAAFIESYGMMAQAAKARGAQPVFITPANLIRCSGSNAVAGRGFITETFSAGNQFNVPVLDLHAKSTDLYNNLGFCPNDVEALITQDGNAVGDFFCNDHTHFAPPGATQIAKVIADGLKELYLPLASYLK